MKRLLPFFVAWLLAAPASAQVDCNAGLEPVDAAAASQLSARDFIKAIVANERDVVKALGSHGYAVDIMVETLKDNGVDGVFHRASVIDFDASGARRETVAPGATNTLTRIRLTERT
jgi:hypothetical protein